MNNKEVLITARQIADFFIAQVDPEREDGMTNLRLQKLVFYAQAYFLGKYKKPLFNEDFSAWQFGPVQENLYHDFKEFGRGEIPIYEALSHRNLNHEVVSFLEDIWAYFGRFTAGFLVELTHDESPWIETWNSDDTIISKDVIQLFYSKKIDDVFE